MYLKEITINGFKSFGTKTRLTLEKGVTAIVGPNGCGKSNIVESIRWVLGEQSAKALRGGKMQDIIFQGAEKRKPHSMCEVSLTFTDCEAQLGTEYNEVEIIRRVTREGNSNYYLNGKTCRLKDIQRLFMDTGVGQVSYSFLMQGQIDQIVSNNPMERRAIFEEAAGISKFKSQRRESLNRLNIVDKDLARILDIMDEVDRQIGTLKRQARKALRYQRLKHRLTHLELANYAWRGGELQKTLGKKTGVEKEFDEDLDKIKNIVAEQEDALNEKRSTLNSLNASLQEAQQLVFNFEKSKNEAMSRAEFCIMRINDLKNRIQELETESLGLESQKNELERLIKENESIVLKEEENLGDSDKEYHDKNEALQSYQKQLVQTELDLSGKKKAFTTLENNLSQYRSQVITYEARANSIEEQTTAINENLSRITESKSTLEKELELLRSTLQESATSLKEKQVAFETEKARILALKESANTLRNQVNQTQNEIGKNETQKSVLQDLQSKLEGFSEGSKAMLQGKLSSIVNDSEFALLLKEVTIKKGYTQAIESLLGSAVDSLLLETPDKISDICNYLNDKKLGRVCVKISPPPSKETKGTQSNHSFTDALDLIEISSEKNTKLIQDLFINTYVCEDLNSFLEFWKANPDFQFKKVATIKGEMIESNGLIYGGEEPGQTESFISRENKIKEIEKILKKQIKELTAQKDNVQEVSDSIQNKEHALEETREVIAKIQQESAKLRSQEESNSRQIKSQDHLLSEQQTRIDRLNNEKETLGTRTAEVNAKLKQAETLNASEFQSITSSEEALSKARNEKEAYLEGVSNARLSLNEKKQRLENQRQKLGDNKNKLQETQNNLARKSNEIKVKNEESEQLQAEQADLKTKTEATGKELTVTQSKLDEEKIKHFELSKSIHEVEKELTKNFSGLRTLDAKANEIKVKIAEERAELNFLSEKVEEEHQVQLNTIEWSTQLDEASKEINIDKDLEEIADYAGEQKKPGELEFDRESPPWDIIRKEIENLRQKILSQGPVNLEAIEEFREANKRYLFLKTQSDDLKSAKDQLLEALEKINSTSQELFEKTFTKVRENFKVTFDKLTGGGEADLILEASDDILNAGIEIIARPPGTRLRQLSLLSGGQKTLTAVALLFAIYMVKPSPFCVLDELDAPLDDVNIRRFTQMLKDFTNLSQFLIITHNKTTITAANAIFGVTMQEKGVSKVISLNLEQSLKTLDKPKK